jgi:hypothetical protein
MTTGAIVARILLLTVVAGGVVYLVSIAGAPSWAVGVCSGVLVLVHALLTRWIVSPRERS